MNKDIVPSLNEKVLKSFNESVDNSSQIKAFYEAIEKKKANMQDVQKYAKALGSLSSKAILKHLTKENLPNGVMYWNIAERIIEPLLKDIHDRVNHYYAIVQEYTNAKKGINLKSVEAPFPTERVKDLIDVLITSFNNNENEL